MLCFSALAVNRTSLVPYERKGRMLLSHEDNETASIADDIFPRYSVKKLSPTEFGILTGETKRPELYAERIQQAVVNRVTFECVQYALAANSGLTFHQVPKPCPDQVKGRPSEVLRSGTRSERFRFASAHAGTSPRPAFSLAGHPTRFFAFLEGSSAYWTWNSTDELPLAVNEVDSDLDGRQRDLKLRESRLSILNQVSQGTLTVVAGHACFVQKFKSALEMKSKIGSGGLERVQVTRMYLKTLNSLLPLFNHSYYDHCLSLHLENAPQANELRSALYPMRQSAMRERAEIQSFLYKQMLDLENQIMTGGNRRPPYLRTVIRWKLLGMLTSRERSYLEEWWGQPKSFYDQRVTEANAAKKLCAQHHRKFLSFIDRCRHYVAEAEKQEQSYRARAVKTVREIKKLSGQEMAEALQTPKAELEALEAGQVTPGSPLIKRIAKVLEVHHVNLFIDQRSI